MVGKELDGRCEMLARDAAARLQDAGAWRTSWGHGRMLVSESYKTFCLVFKERYLVSYNIEGEFGLKESVGDLL